MAGTSAIPADDAFLPPIVAIWDAAAGPGRTASERGRPARRACPAVGGWRWDASVEARRRDGPRTGTHDLTFSLRDLLSFNRTLPLGGAGNHRAGPRRHAHRSAQTRCSMTRRRAKRDDTRSRKETSRNDEAAKERKGLVVDPGYNIHPVQVAPGCVTLDVVVVDDDADDSADYCVAEERIRCDREVDAHGRLVWVVRHDQAAKRLRAALTKATGDPTEWEVCARTVCEAAEVCGDPAADTDEDV